MQIHIHKAGTIVGKIPEEGREHNLQSFFELRAEAMAFHNLMEISKDTNDVIGDFIDGLYMDLMDRMRDSWLPIFKKIGIPWFYFFRCKTTTEGYLYITPDPFHDEKNNKEGENNMKNINDGKPVDGTILGTLTQVEMDRLLEIDSVTAALNNMTINVTSVEDFLKYLEQFKQMEKNRLEAWLPISRRLKVPLEWDLRADYSNGYVFVLNYDKPYEED